MAALGLSLCYASVPACAATGENPGILVPRLQHERLLSIYSAPAQAAAAAPAVVPTAAPAVVPTAVPATAPAAAPAADARPAVLALATPVDAAPIPLMPAEAPPAAGAELTPERAALELVGGDGRMSNGYGHARLMSLRGTAVTSLGVVQGELTQQSRFGFSGNYGNVSLTHDLSKDYYTTVGVGVGNSPLFSSWRTDATAYRKFGSERQYVAGIGGYYAKGNESARSDKGLLFTGIAYFSGLVVEGGVRLNWADPGAILGPSQYIAATFGNDDRRAIIVRYEHAKETYKVLPGGPELVNFKSDTASIQWRQRISRDSMLLAALEYYQSPVYDRLSFSLGWRWSFR
ncbi:MAG: hypothetical protein JWQ61_325 [Collimonas fungivorans]|nr:hypothetical protein [Collimonas fungivorans]